MKTSFRFTPIWAMVPLVLIFTGCGGSNPLIKTITFKNEEIAGKVNLILDTELGVNLPAVIPITLPISNVGSLTVLGNHIILDVDATEALKLNACEGSQLPNGTALPVAIPSGLKVACVPINGSDSRVYIGFSGKQILAGFALALKMDNPTGVPLNVMLPIPLKIPNLQAVGGTFFGPINGLAVFAVSSPAAPAVNAPSALAAQSKDVQKSGEIKLLADPLTRARKNALRNAYYGNDQVAVQ